MQQECDYQKWSQEDEKLKERQLKNVKYEMESLFQDQLLFSKMDSILSYRPLTSIG